MVGPPAMSRAMGTVGTKRGHAARQFERGPPTLSPLDTPSTEALRSRRYTVGACEHMGAQGNAGYSGRHRKRVWRFREAERQSEPTSKIGAEQKGARAPACTHAPQKEQSTNLTAPLFVGDTTTCQSSIGRSILLGYAGCW